MPIRPLDLLDLPIIAKYRNDALTLDSARALTRGHPLGAAGFMAYFNPARHLYSAIANGNGDSILGGVIHSRGETFAKLLYITPASQMQNPELPALIEHLAAEAGKWGVYHVIAEVDEVSDAFDVLRKSGFSVYAWQRMWDISTLTESASGSEWKRASSVDLPALQSLHYQIVPPLLHPVEPAPNHAAGFVWADGLKSYVSVTSGMYGILLTPLIHPEVTNVGAKIAALVMGLPDKRNRPVYLAVRSYQAWLEPVLEDLGAKAAARQAVMVKRLARFVQEGQAAPVVPAGARVQTSQVSRAKIDE